MLGYPFNVSNEPIGCIDVAGMNSVGAPEIGYALSYDYWKKGIMTEAVKAVIEELFRCGFEKISACHAIDNPASGKVMEKRGMTYIKMLWRKRNSAQTSNVK